MRRLIVAALWFVALGSLAHAERQDNRTCVDGLIFDEPAADRPGVVNRKAPRAYFHAGLEAGPDCPAAGERCRAKTYVVPGDAVIVAPQTVPGFVCAAYIDRRGLSIGSWLLADAVDIRPVPQVRLEDWLGEWKYRASTIAISRGKAPDSLKLDGTTSFRKSKYIVREGSITAEIAPAGRALDFADHGGETVPFAQRLSYECAARLALIGPVLVVDETTGHCAGQGADFTGFYRRVR